MIKLPNAIDPVGMEQQQFYQRGFIQHSILAVKFKL